MRRMNRRVLLAAVSISIIGIPGWSAHPNALESERRFDRPTLTETTVCETVVWRGGGEGNEWGDPENWAGGIVPRSCDVAVFDASSPDVFVDPSGDSEVAGITLEAGFRGTVRLGKEILVNGSLTISGGTIDPGEHALAAVSMLQTNGLFLGGEAPLWVEGAAVIEGGILETPSSLLHATSMTIRAPGVVRMGRHGKLELTGHGMPLTGDGVLDTTRNGLNTVEFTSPAAEDVLSAGPVAGLRAILEGVPGGSAIGNTKAVRHGFGEVDRVQLLRGEGGVQFSVIDAVSGFGYFGTSDSPGIIIKVRLSDFTRVASLTLQPGEDDLTSAVLDSTNGFLYVGTWTYPGRIIKIRLSDFTRVDALTLGQGEYHLGTALIDEGVERAYFVTSASASKIIEVDLASFERGADLTLDTAERVSAAVLDSVGGHAYFATGWSPATVIRVRLSDLTRIDTLTLDSGEDNARSAAVDPAAGFIYLGMESTLVVKVRLSDFTRVGACWLNSGEDSLNSAVIDPAADFVYFTVDDNFKAEVVRVRLSTFAREDSISLAGPTIGFQLHSLMTSAVDPVGGYAFFCTESPGTILRVRLLDFVEDAGMRTYPGEGGVRAVALDLEGGYAYLGSWTKPSIIVKVRLSDMTRIGALTLGIDDGKPTTAVTDAAEGQAYFAMATLPGSVVRLQLSDFTFNGKAMFAEGEDRPYSAVIDPADGHAYFGTNTLPGSVVKLNLASFSEVGSITLDPGEGGLVSAVIDVPGGLAYFGTDRSPASVVKIDLETFARSGATTLDAGEDNLTSAVIDAYGEYAYWGTSTNPSTVVQTRLADLARNAALPFESGESALRAGAIDPTTGLAYFANFFNPGHIVKIRVPEMSRVAAFTPEGSPWNFSWAAVDPSSGLAYFATASGPTLFVKVDLGNTRTALETSLSGPGRSVTFTATVEPVVSGGGTPTGTVGFSADGENIENCSSVALDGGGQADCTTKGLEVGEHDIEAFYGGDSGFNPSSGSTAWILWDLIFSDDFELGNTDTWSSAVP